MLKTETILEMPENGYNVENVYSDFAKGYNKVRPKILLMKLDKIEIRGNNLK